MKPTADVTLVSTIYNMCKNDYHYYESLGSVGTLHTPLCSEPSKSFPCLLLRRITIDNNKNMKDRIEKNIETIMNSPLLTFPSVSGSLSHNDKVLAAKMYCLVEVAKAISGNTKKDTHFPILSDEQPSQEHLIAVKACLEIIQPQMAIHRDGYFIRFIAALGALLNAIPRAINHHILNDQKGPLPLYGFWKTKGQMDCEAVSAMLNTALNQ